MKVRTLRYAIGFLILFLQTIPSQAQEPRQKLHSHLRAAVASGQAKQLGPLSPGQRLELSIVLPLRNQAELTSLLTSLYDPSSPDYHHFLSVAEFTERFAPTADDFEAAVAFARSNGFTVKRLPANRMVVPVSGAVEQVEKAFDVKMRKYRHPTENREFFSPDREPSLPANLKVTHIAGLNNFSIPRPMFTRASAVQPLDSSALSGSGPGGLFLGSDMRAAYYGGTELTGKGQIVGLVEFDGFSQSDVDLTFSSSGQFYSVPVVKVPIADATGAACQSVYPCSDIEQVVDIVQAIGMAPGLSQVRVYIGGYDAEVLNEVAAENLAKEISISWSWAPDDPATDDPFFEECAAQGQSVFVASGDYGTYVAGNEAYPAESAYVTAVGATDLVTTGPAGRWSSESAWSDSGGGVSPDGIALPGWQKGVASSSNGASTTLRNVPDVAMEGNTDSYFCAQGSCIGAVGGTSLAAPRWAAFIALANEQGNNAGDPLIGFLNPALYTLAQGSNGSTDLHDVVSGSNDYAGTCSGHPFCQAVSGFDLVTGWGSAAGQPLIDALAPPATKGFALSSSANTLTIGPGSSASATINVVKEGNFSGEVAFTLTGLPAGITAAWGSNPTTSGSQLTFTASATAQRGSYGVTVTGASGTLTATTVLTLGVNAPGFAIYAAPADLQTPEGGSVSTTIKTEYFGGFSGNVGLAITSPLPSGVTATWTQNPTSSQTTLTLNVAQTVPVGTTMLTVTGSSGGLLATTTVSLDVSRPAVLPSTSPTFLPVTPGGSAITTLTAVPSGTPHGSFTLSANQLPAGVTVSFNPAIIFAGQTSQVTVTTDNTTPLGLNGFTVETSPQSSSDEYGFWGVDLLVSSQPVASVVVSPSYAVLSQGGKTTVNITVNELNGFTGKESLYVAPPPGVTASFSENPTSSSSVLTLTASATAQPGPWNSGLCYTTNPNSCDGYIDDFFVIVQPAPAFSLTPSASSITVTPGGSAHTTIAVAPQTGFTGNVQLAVISALPDGVNATFGQNPTTGSSVLTVSASSSVAPAQYLLEIAGTAGSQTASISLPLVVAGSTTTNLTVTPDTAGKSPQNSYILAATVLTASGQPAHGQVNFCDTASPYCTDMHLLGTAQLTSRGTALLRLHAAPGTHSYKAVFPGTANTAAPEASSSSAEVSITAKGATTTTLAASGSPGNYTLTANVTGAGAIAPGGSVSFTDSTGGNVTPANAVLGSGTQNLNFSGPSSTRGFNLPVAIASADFNGDGIPDLAVVNKGTNTVAILTGNGDGTFTAMPNPIPTDSQPDAIAAGDFNADGNPDLAVVNFAANTVTILLGSGDGTFAATPASPGTGNWPIAVAAADFNRDGNLDLAVGNLASRTISILLGNGDGTFTAQTGEPTNVTCPYAVGIGDFNGDGVPDLAVPDGCESSVFILLGNGDGTFSTAPAITVGTQPTDIVVGDFNRDGKADLAVTNLAAGTVTVLLGNGDGTFTPQAAISASLNQPVAAVVADFNGDSMLDLAVTDQSTNMIEVFLGNGDGTFSTSPIGLPADQEPTSLVVGDFNQDGAPDLVAANFASGSLTAKLTQLSSTATAAATNVSVTGAGTQSIAATFPGDNNYSSSASSGISLTPLANPVPTVSGLSPTHVNAGSAAFTLTVSGSGFVAGSTVYWGGSALATQYSNGTQLSAQVPASAVATGGNYAITVQTPAPGGGVSNQFQFEVDTPGNPVPVVTGVSPANVNAGNATFTLTVNGSGFTTGSTVYWGGSGLTTQFTSGTKLSAQVPASDVATAGIFAVTVQTPVPGGGVSNQFQFEVDTAASGTAGAPSFSSTSATIAAGAAASYPVALPSSATAVSATCLNLPAGASCSYSTASGAVTVSTSSTTPAGTYQITVVFSETLPGSASAFVMLPILLLPLAFFRRRLEAKGVLWTVSLGAVLLVCATLWTGCGGGGSSPVTPPSNPTHQATSSGVVSLTVQ